MQNTNPTNSARSISNVRTRSATVSYEFNISNPCVREDNDSNAETADSYTHPESNPPSQQMSPVALRHMSPVQASAASETELYPPSNPSPAGTELYPPETPPLAFPRAAPAGGGRPCVVAHSQRQGQGALYLGQGAGCSLSLRPPRPAGGSAAVKQ